MHKLLVATSNPNKVKEFSLLLSQQDVEIESLLDYPDFEDVDETGITFEENARLKAQAAAQTFNVPTVADDSGLMVDYLHGQPGVLSARYAGDHNDAANNAKLLVELGGIPLAERTASFVTTLVYINPLTNKEFTVSGQLDGLILPVPQGKDGFGYDPLFYVPELQKTLAELTAEQKNEISHRGRAVRAFAQEYQEYK